MEPGSPGSARRKAPGEEYPLSPKNEKPMTQTEKTTYALIGKTFIHFYEGAEIARGKVLGMTSANAIQLAVRGKEDDREWFEIHSVADLGYDRGSRTGYRFSMDNPHREEPAD
jgi:hypothetical protein